jgi:hypothetical protein
VGLEPTMPFRRQFCRLLYSPLYHPYSIFFVGRVGFEPTSCFRTQFIRLVPVTARVPTNIFAPRIGFEPMTDRLLSDYIIIRSGCWALFEILLFGYSISSLYTFLILLCLSQDWLGITKWRPPNSPNFSICLPTESC